MNSHESIPSLQFDLDLREATYRFLPLSDIENLRNKILSFLPLSEIGTIATISKGTAKSYINEHFWKQQVQCYFPHLIPQDTVDELTLEIKRHTSSTTSWKKQFETAYAQEYKSLSLNVKKLFNQVKRGALSEIPTDGKPLPLEYFIEQDKRGKTAIDWATTKNHQDILDHFFKIILKHYNDHPENLLPEASTIKRNMLDWAMLCRQDILTLYLLCISGCQINQPCLSGEFYPLHRAALEGREDYTKYFLENKANINVIIPRNGKTPLYFAAKFGHDKVVKVLLERKADASIKSRFLRPIEIAILNKHINVINVFDSDQIKISSDLVRRLNVTHKNIMQLLLKRNILLTSQREADAAILDAKSMTVNPEPLQRAAAIKRLKMEKTLNADVARAVLEYITTTADIDSLRLIITSEEWMRIIMKHFGAILQVAVESDQLLIIKYLFRIYLLKKDDAIFNFKNATELLILALKYERSQIIEYILSQPDWVIQIDADYLTNEVYLLMLPMREKLNIMAKLAKFNLLKNHPNWFSEGYIYEAIKYENLELLKTLYELYPDATYAFKIVDDKAFKNPLDFAIFCKFKPGVEYLLDTLLYESDPLIWHPAFLAIKYQSWNVLSLTLGKASEKDRYEILQFYILKNDITVTKYIIQLYPELIIDYRFGPSPLTLAYYQGHKELFELMMTFQPDIQHDHFLIYYVFDCDKDDDMMVNKLLEAKADITHEITGIVRRGKTKWLKQIMEGCSPEEMKVKANMRVGNGQPILHIAAYSQQFDMIKYLHTCGADLNAVAVVSDFKDDNSRFNGVTALHCAAQTGNLAIAEYLLTHNADVDAMTSQKLVPLEFALGENHQAMVQLLLKYLANPALAIHKAAEKGRLDLVKQALFIDPDSIEQEDNMKQTPLLWASANGHKKVVEFLLAKNANLFAATTPSDAKCEEHGLTPLTWAWRNNHRAVVDLLLEKAGIHAIKALGAKTEVYPELFKLAEAAVQKAENPIQESKRAEVVPVAIIPQTMVELSKAQYQNIIDDNKKMVSEILIKLKNYDAHLAKNSYVLFRTPQIKRQEVEKLTAILENKTATDAQKLVNFKQAFTAETANNLMLDRSRLGVRVVKMLGTPMRCKKETVAGGDLVKDIGDILNHRK